MDTNELLSKIRKLELKTRGLTKHIFSGEYHSAFKGRGMAFSEVKEYSPGDEVRTIDWNVTARHNKPYIKVFEEERELSVLLVIDVSASSGFGTLGKTKKELALEIAAVICFSAISNNDKVGVVFASDTVEKYIAPEKGRKHGLKLLREIIEFRPKSKLTNLAEAMKFVQNTQKKRTTTFVLSDFIDPSSFLDGFKIASKRHDLIALSLHDEAERILPDVGRIQLFNAESDSFTWVNTSNKETRANYTTNFDSNLSNLKESLRRIGVDHLCLFTHEDYILPLVKLFQKR